MAHLTLTGVSADGKRLLLMSERGAEFTLDINPALRAALRGDTTRLGQLEIQMSSSLRPREIQDRIRSGEAPDAVADLAGTTLEAIMPYVAPVLAEREHIARRAQRASLRRTPGEGGSSAVRALDDAVAAHLVTQDLKVDAVEWDSFRRDDGKWTLTATFDAPRRSGIGHFTFDARGNYVAADDDDARWLVGDLLPAPVAAPLDDLQQVRQRRLAAVDVPLGEADLGVDAIDLVNDTPTPGSAPAADVRADIDTAVPTGAPAEAQSEVEETEEPEQAEEIEQRVASGDDERGKHRRPVQKKRGRASVPSWDEIMFGSSEGDHG